MFHIIGVAHRAQVIAPGSKLNADQQRLSTWLSELVQEVKPTLIAEEQSLEGLGVNQSIPQQIAEKAGIVHRFCDPDSKQRAAMGYRNKQDIWEEMFISSESWDLSNDEMDVKAGAIEIARYFSIRERFWLEQLANRLNSEVVFVCGDAHVDGFVKLLNANKIPSRIVDRAIGLNDEDRYTLENALNYLQKHPELRS
ncbi:MAG TPA: hypothetical protein VKA02_11935 [Candidatus Acidoferrum sp.]|nr:hypothetical protein [Candidatus Acidoferrum sp.]